jgi:hypothetical protein
MKRNLFLPHALMIYLLILIIAFPFSATASQAEIQSQFANQIQEFYGKSGHYSGILAILFLSLGPSELIPVFPRLSHGAYVGLRRQLAKRSTLIASICTVGLSIIGPKLLLKYNIHLTAILASCGLVLFWLP